MPGWLPRAYLLAVATVAVFAAGLWLLHRLRTLLVVLLVSLFLALAIEPAVNRLSARGWRRGLATGVVLGALAGVVLGFFTLLGSLLASEVTALVQATPDYLNHVIAWYNRSFHARISQGSVTRWLTGFRRLLEEHVSELAGDVWGIGTTAVAVVFQSLAVALFTFYLSADGPRVRRAVCSLLPPLSPRDASGRCCGPGRSPWTRRADTSTPARFSR